MVLSGGLVSRRVLVVEDEASVAHALARWLKRQGAAVRVVLDPLTLEVVLAEFEPTHVVSDLIMPARDGLEVMSLVKRLAPLAVRSLLSGSLDSLDAERLREVMPCRLVAKPWSDVSLAFELGLEEKRSP